MSTVGKPVKVQKEKPAKMNSSQNGKTETSLANKNQPTAEQIRLAQIISDRSEGDPEITAKVNQIIDLTGRSSDEVMTVLYDCDYDINRTVERLLESQEAIVDEWQVIDKKKKLPAPNKGSPPETPSDLKFETLTEPEFELNHAESHQRGRGARGAPRFPRGRGRSSWSDRSDRPWNSTGRERETGYDSNRARRRGNFGELRSRGGRRGQHSMHSNKFETQIDTWTSESTPNGENDSRIGSWTEVTDEWTADEWNGSLNESCVFTPSASSRSTQIYSASNDMNNGLLASAVRQGTAMTFESMNRLDQGGMPGNVSAGGSGTSFSSMLPLAKTSSGQDSMGQHYVAKDSSPSSPSANEVGNCFGNISDRTMFVSHYNREATECIKNVMGIGRNSLGQNSPATDEIVRTAGHQPPVGLQPSSSLHIQGIKHVRPRLPPPSKIPSMPVEMPDSMNSGRLDVQFGSWDVIPAASDSKASFISDIIPPTDYKGSAKISSSQTPSVSGMTRVMAQPLASSYEPNMSKAQVTLSESHVTPMSKANPFPSSLAANKGNETLHHMMSSSSSDLLTSVTKAGGSASSSQLGFSQLAYSSSSCDGVSGGGASAKLLPSNGPNHYNASISFHSGPSSLVTMSSEYNLTQEQLQYTYGDSQRYRANGPPPTQQNFSSAVFPPGYNSGPLPNQLHYGSSPGPAKLFASEKPSTNVYSMGSDVAGLYADKQGAAFSTSLAPQSFDSTSVYQSAGVFHSGSQPSSISLAYPGIASGLTFQGMQVESSGFDTEQYPAYRQKDGPTGYDIAGAADGQKSAVTSVQGQINQSFSSNFGSGSNGATQSNGGSPFTGQNQSALPMGTQGQSASSVNQRQGVSAGPGFANHTSSSAQSFVGQVEASTSATVLSGGVVLSATAGGKLSDSVSKLNLKDGKPGDLGPMTTSADGTSISAAGGTTSIGSTVASTVTSIMTSKTSLSVAAKSSLSQSKPLTNMATGMASGAAAMLNHNYVIGQPPGFQLAAFGYPTAQQPLTYSSFEELQMLQQRFSNPMPYYDLALQTSAALASREPTGPLGVQSYTGSDMKLAAMDVLSPVNAQPTQQPQAVTGNQQAFINHGLHPAAAYSYYYPGPTGILPYYPMVPMAIPSVSNPTLAGTTSTTQFQKPAVFGSHAYAMGGQAQDFTKTFGNSQVSNKPSAGMATGMNAPSGDLMTAAAGFGKTHVQTFERGGFHGGTPPPNFGMAMPGGTQAAGAPAVYGPPYLPLVPPHQQSHSQLLHHAVPQDSAVAGRPALPTGAQQKMGGNKAYGTTYWGPN